MNIIFKWSEYRSGYTFPVGDDAEKYCLTASAMKTLFPDARLGHDYVTDEESLKAAAARVDAMAMQ